VVGGEPPYKVVIRDGSDRPVGSARLLSPVQVRLVMRGDLSAGVAEVTDGAGRSARAPVSQDQPQISLSLED
jgi:hypothetical protein